MNSGINSNPFKRPFSEVQPGKKRPIDKKALNPQFLVDYQESQGPGGAYGKTAGQLGGY